ncbi:MAG: hypothetical protein LBG88_02840, partial [Christensenellaceae bacterium]|nr:hypothetical protein [Christensenellaceae bacterium]
MIIGLCGKVGSGKTYIGKQLSELTGFRFVKLDYHAGKVVNIPFLKGILQRRIKNKIPRATENIQLFPLLKNMDKPFSNFEFYMFKRFLNKRLKKLMRKNENLI